MADQVPNDYFVLNLQSNSNMIGIATTHTWAKIVVSGLNDNDGNPVDITTGRAYLVVFPGQEPHPVDAAVNDIIASQEGPAGPTDESAEPANEHAEPTDEPETEQSLFLPEVQESSTNTVTAPEIKQEPHDERVTETLNAPTTEQPIREINYSMLHASKKRGRSNQELQEESVKKNPAPRMTKKERTIHACKVKLQVLHTLLRDAKATGATRDVGQRLSVISKLSRQIHEMEYYQDLSQPAIEASKVLDADALPALKANNIRGFIVPGFLILDATALLHRWTRGDIDPNPHRGLMLSNHHWVADPGYPFKVACNYHGEGDLVVGQWFASFESAKVAGAHGAPGSGIHGDIQIGAFSIVMNGGTYDDVDNGTSIQYCSPKGKAKDSPATSTKYMLKSFNERHEIRVLRGSGLPSRFRPEKGLRYDGLYVINSCDLVDEQRSAYRFNMTRKLGQYRIRSGGTDGRPTKAELNQIRTIV